jgi:hemerythrin-like domain-containing protein
MKRHETLIPLSNEHFSHLVFAKRLREGKPEKIKSNWPEFSNEKELIKQSIDYFTIDMLNHFELEEKEVFPIYEQYLEENSNELNFLKFIIKHHQIVKDKINSLYGLAGQGLKDKLLEIGTDIEEHIRNEERKLFEDIQKKIPIDELVSIGAILKEKSTLKCSNFL